MDGNSPELLYLGGSAICGFIAGIYANRSRFQAVCGVILAFANEAREYYQIKADGKITDIEAQELAATVDAFFMAVERLGVEMKNQGY